MIELGVNVDHVATLRQQRKTSYPDPAIAALEAENSGADLITLHLREDRRHIQDSDVYKIRSLLFLSRMNLECSLASEILEIAIHVKPDNVCLVPERRNEITTEGGLDVSANALAIEKAIMQLTKAGIKVTLFIDPEPHQVIIAAKIGAFGIEIHTGFYEQSFNEKRDYLDSEISRIKATVEEGLRYGLRVHAGHGLNYQNVVPIARIKGISELNIGHAIVSNAIFHGWKKSIKEMKTIIAKANI